ncbi:unnamed protein product, partial [marine sediment metagenome]
FDETGRLRRAWITKADMFQSGQLRNYCDWRGAKGDRTND